MAVFPEWQGKVGAGALLQAVETELRSKQCKRIIPDTTAPLGRRYGSMKSTALRHPVEVSEWFVMRLCEAALIIQETP